MEMYVINTVFMFMFIKKIVLALLTSLVEGFFQATDYKHITAAVCFVLFTGYSAVISQLSLVKVCLQFYNLQTLF